MEFTIPGNQCKRVVLTASGTIQDYIRFESKRENIKWYIKDVANDSYIRVPIQLEELLEREYQNDN